MMNDQYRGAFAGPARDTAEEASDINLLIKPRNARILRLMRARGWPTVYAMCRALNRHPTEVGFLVNMTKSPVNKASGEWTVGASRLAEDLHVEPEDLWPDYMRQIVAKKAATEIEVSLDQAIAISSNSAPPDYLLENKQVMDTLLGVLTPRERAIVTLRMYGGTLEECGRALGVVGLGGVTKERFRQMEVKAHRKMKRAALVKFHASHVRDLLAADS